MNRSLTNPLRMRNNFSMSRNNPYLTKLHQGTLGMSDPLQLTFYQLGTDRTSSRDLTGSVEDSTGLVGVPNGGNAKLITSLYI